MELIDVKKLFTKGSFQNRIDFISNNDRYDTNEKDYLAKVIVNTKKTTNEWYLIALIDLAAKMRIVDKELLDRYLKFLIEPSSFYLKLTVLDYITDTYELYRHHSVSYIPVRQILSKRQERLITKNQALLNLILLYPSEKEYFMKLLENNLPNTNDYRSHIRIYNNILDTKLKCYLSANYIMSLIKISESMNLGKGVIDVINRLKKIIG